MVLDQEMTTLIFDFDGTLFHLPVDYGVVRRDLALAPGVKVGPSLQRFIDDGDEASLAVVTRHEVAAVATGSFTKGAPDCLTGGNDVAIVTRNSREAVRAALGPLADTIVIVGREDVRRLKPDPDGVLLAMEKLGADPAGTALIGDTFHDVEAARAAGVHSVVVHNPLLDYAPDGADLYLDDLRQVVDQLTKRGTNAC
jgi:beta-phosphoglucomutase-like phosphatase (HAD superfamily)